VSSHSPDTGSPSDAAESPRIQANAEAQFMVGLFHSTERGELQQAFQYFEVAIRHGSLEAFHLLAKIHATTADFQP
jgi:TPR repeat protein